MPLATFPKNPSKPRVIYEFPEEETIGGGIIFVKLVELRRVVVFEIVRRDSCEMIRCDNGDNECAYTAPEDTVTVLPRILRDSSSFGELSQA